MPCSVKQGLFKPCFDRGRGVRTFCDRIKARITLNKNDMSWEMKTPSFESEDNKLKKQINEQLESLLKSGAKLTAIVDLLDARDFFNYERRGRSEPVAYFDVEGFVKKRISENRKVSLPTKYKKIDKVIYFMNEIKI